MPMKTRYRIAVCYQNRVTFLLNQESQVWREENIDAETAEEAIRLCHASHENDPQERRAVGFAVIGCSRFE